MALAIMGIIGVITSQAFYTAQTSAAATREAMERLGKIDRVFVLLENDLRNALPVVRPRSFGQPLSPLYVTPSEDYWLTILRGGYDNSLFLPRTEEVRVGYRLVDDVLWRDTWYNPTLSDQEDARPGKLLDGVKTLTVEVLDTTATSLVSGWLRDWPKTQGSPELPRALRITLELEEMGEITRLYSLLQGLPPGQAQQQPPNRDEDKDDDDEPSP